ncbi:MAG: class I SAM-dependent methyltransferase [Gammaproteobacteria bacterium]
MGFARYRGKRVLELGFGQGTDLCQFAKAGAQCSGVDLTPEHFERAGNHFRLLGLDAELFLEDASQLHFDDASFDVVYSFGVLHHTPDIDRCLAEAHRVLRPNGELILGLYHRWSVFHLISVLLVSGLIRGGLWRLGYRGLLSTVEQGADGRRIKPLVNLYTKRGLKRLLGDFRDVRVSVHHLEKSHFSMFRRLVPAALVRWLEPRMGWYLVARAVK